MKRKSVPSNRNIIHKQALSHEMEKGARVATQWAILEFKKVVEDGEAQAKSIIDNARHREEKAKKKLQKARRVLQDAITESDRMLRYAQEEADEIIEDAIQDADNIIMQAAIQAITVIDLTKEED
jgi:F0F1-type ATP synthase membrane subunit b/b'